MSELHWLFPEVPPGPPPANLQRRVASRQNNLLLADGDHVLVTRPDSSGGPSVWVWHVANIGPGTLWMRWDGRGYAEINDEHSIQIAAQGGFQFISAALLTMASQGGGQVSFTAENMR